VVQLGGLRFKTGFDVPQTLAPCELGESKTMELVMTRVPSQGWLELKLA
jgi:hypothetical protein